ncbi:hypothetical protein JR064_06215 [Xanthomonas sp. CFBP 8703]|jgi:hypothetical protein|uniref:Secreted protein n=1 Tax=Xanthomonas bonasiae TaxID=2810351 RepID=A0ABS3AZG4_9XANT|nr:hypothetical protein [Xanthomonas bonasiae]MBN6112597.1 hypothetical protein [Xanthomonas bonasiae]
MDASTRFLLASCVIGLLQVPAAMAAPMATAASATDESLMTPAEVRAHGAWRDTMAHLPAPAEGCFHATYPSTDWQADTCKTLTRHVHPIPHRVHWGATETTGNGYDYALQSSTLISKTVGSFPQVSGVTSETGVGVSAFGGGGILGPNEYSLQINSNYDGTTSVCNGHSGCTVWQQFVYATDYETQGEAAVFIQYWLIGYGSSCPSGWLSDGGTDCYRNSNAVSAPDVPATQLANVKLTGSATANGNDSITFTNGSTAYSISAKDSVVKLATVWKSSEFNVVGNAGGSRANFNSGSSITVKVAATNGSTAAPTCAANAGTTGETNNLNLGSCTASGGSTPSIAFTEAN